jgi:hypothetical protein
MFIARLLRSPLMALFFLVVPLMAFGQRFIGLPLPMSFDVLLANNVLFLVWLGMRLVVVYLRRIPAAIRYGPDKLIKAKGAAVPVESGAARERLEGAGYVFDRSGAYGERRDRGFWGALLVHAGLVFTLAFGTYDNLVQFSGTLHIGVGEAKRLYDMRSYATFVDSDYSPVDEVRMKLRAKKQMPPSAEWPRGATEIVLYSKEDEELQRGVVAPERPMQIGEDMEVRMSGFIYDTWVAVETVEHHVVYTGWTRMLKLEEKLGDYTHYGPVYDDFFKVEGGAWYDPEKKNLKFELKREGTKVADVVLTIGGVFKKEYDGNVVTLNGVGHWSELHVVRKRHNRSRLAGGFVALAGIFIRLLFRQKRVWLEDKDGGTLVRATDRKALRSLRT